MDSTTVIYLNLPTKIKGFVVHNFEENYNTIVLNCRHSYYQNVETYKHELKHIKANDFYSKFNSTQLETLRH